ncbi:steryl-sulfatase-like, partial [Pundamilia nyererei]|uniref:Steryl-sulfatase-like n=1 Tax=Pundamilia nyererei TaxID=303518 RepID=A0A9Y6M7F4_9CICH
MPEEWRVLKNKGGKWHLGLNCESRDDHCHHPNNHGFNYFFGIPLTNLRDCQPGHGTIFQFHKYLPYRTMGIVLLTTVVLHYSGVIGRSIVEQPYKSENMTQRMVHEAVDFIERNSNRPFLLLFSFLQVHTAIFASAAFRGTSRHGIYGDAVQEVDWSVGQLMEMLDRLSLRGKTLVYLTSDQGAHLEEISARGDVHGGSNGIYK